MQIKLKTLKKKGKAKQRKRPSHTSFHCINFRETQSAKWFQIERLREVISFMGLEMLCTRSCHDNLNISTWAGQIRSKPPAAGPNKWTEYTKWPIKCVCVFDLPRLVYVALQLLDAGECEMVWAIPSSSRSAWLPLFEVGDTGGGQEAGGSRRGDSSSLAGREVADEISVSWAGSWLHEREANKDWELFQPKDFKPKQARI